MKPAFDQFKQRMFSGHSVLTLHRRDILRKTGPFVVLQDFEKEAEFNDAILDLYSELPYVAISVVIDKVAHARRPAVFYHDSYHVALALMMERFAGLLVRKEKCGNVVIEARGAQDVQLADNGTRFRAA